MKVWAGVILFFGVGAAIARWSAFHMIDRGGSVVGAMAIGTFAGGYGAWLVFYVVLKTLKTTNRVRPRTGRGGGVAGG